MANGFPTSKTVVAKCHKEQLSWNITMQSQRLRLKRRRRMHSKYTMKICLPFGKFSTKRKKKKKKKCSLHFLDVVFVCFLANFSFVFFCFLFFSSFVFLGVGFFRQFYLQAESKFEYDRWVKFLRGLLDDHKIKALVTPEEAEERTRIENIVAITGKKERSGGRVQCVLMMINQSMDEIFWGIFL